jgi:hypothetical protein
MNQKTFIILIIVITITIAVSTGIYVFLNKKTVLPPESPKKEYSVKNFSINEYGWAFGDRISEINIQSSGPITGYEWDAKEIKGTLNDEQKTAILDLFSQYDILHLEPTKTRENPQLMCDGGGGLSVMVDDKIIWSTSDECGECYPKKSCEFAGKLRSLILEIVKSTYLDVSICTASSCISLVAKNTKNPKICSSLTGYDKEGCLSNAIKQAQKSSYCFDYYKDDRVIETCLREIGKISPSAISEDTIEELCEKQRNQKDGKWLVDGCYSSWAITLMDTKYCFKMTAQEPNGCIHSVATVKKDPAICAQITNDQRDRDGCYANQAVLKNDIELCKIIQGIEQRKLCENALRN